MGAILGFIAGLLLGIYIVSGGENTLGLAAIAIGATVGTPLLVWYLQDSSERRKEAISIRQRNEDKFGLHALDLNSHVFNPSISATLEFPLERYPAEVSSGLGLLVRTTGPQTFGIAGLANWEYGLEHMLANLALRGAWEDVTAKVAAYMDLKREAANAHRQRFSELVRADYGPDMRISQNIIETPPTCDVESLVWLALGRRGSLSRRDFFIPGGPVQAGVPDAPTLISVGTQYILNGRNRAEADPARLQRIFDAVWIDAPLSARARTVAEAQRDAQTAIAQLCEEVRRYSNRILTARTFEGDCDVCRSWTPR